MTLSNRCGCSDKLLWCAALLVAITAGQMPVTVKGPEFLQPLENHTVTQGRDVYFTCVVNHLSDYKVAWIKSDSKAILAIHTHMVAHNPRLSVTHNGHNTWKLHVSNVQRSDSGTYMCQINTDPMQNQMGHLSVVVSPDIIDDEFPADGYSANEGGSVRLRCRATGVPEPTVSWRREDNKNIVLRHEGGREKQAMWTYENDTLLLTNIQRSDMGAYMCIASNMVPPSVSKRFIVQVHFHPAIKVSQHVVAAPIESDVTIQCYVETSPRALNSWSRDTGEKLIQGTKYKMTEVVLNDYSLLMNLTIRSLHKSEFGGYICSSQNVLGKDQGLIRLQELYLLVKTTTTTTPMAPRVNDMVKPRTKPPLGKDNLKKKKRPPKGASGEAGRGVFDYDDETGLSGGTTFPPRYAFEPKTTEYVTTPPWISLASDAVAASIATTAAACFSSLVLLRCL